MGTDVTICIVCIFQDLFYTAVYAFFSVTIDFNLESFDILRLSDRGRRSGVKKKHVDLT